MSQAMRKLAGAVGKSNCIAIFINQLRLKVGVVYGNPEVTSGGNALKYYASVRLDVRRTETLKVGGESVGSHTKVRVVKNKVAPPFREAEFDVLYGQGISYEGELIDLGVKLDVVQKSGSWYNFGELRLGQGRDAAREFLKANKETADAIDAQIREKLKSQAAQRSTSSRPLVEIPMEGSTQSAAKAKLDIEVED